MYRAQAGRLFVGGHQVLAERRGVQPLSQGDVDTLCERPQTSKQAQASGSVGVVLEPGAIPATIERSVQQRNGGDTPAGLRVKIVNSGSEQFPTLTIREVQ